MSAHHPNESLANNEDCTESGESFVVLHRFQSSVANLETSLNDGGGEAEDAHNILIEADSDEQNENLSDDEEEERISRALQIAEEQRQSVHKQNQVLKLLVEKIQADKLPGKYLKTNFTDKLVRKLCAEVKLLKKTIIYTAATRGQRRLTRYQFWKKCGNIRYSPKRKRNIDPDTLNNYFGFLIFTALASFTLALIAYYVIAKLEKEKYLGSWRFF